MCSLADCIRSAPAGVTPLKLRRDAYFIAAVLVAPLFWLGWWSIYPVAHAWDWPLEAPGRFLMPTLIYPVIEELAFRGAMQGALYRRSWGRRIVLGLSGANIFTSLIFCAFHLVYRAALAASLVFVPSLIFGHFRDRYHSVIPAVALHVWYNAGFFWLVS